MNYNEKTRGCNIYRVASSVVLDDSFSLHCGEFLISGYQSILGPKPGRVFQVSYARIPGFLRSVNAGESGDDNIFFQLFIIVAQDDVHVIRLGQFLGGSEHRSSTCTSRSIPHDNFVTFINLDTTVSSDCIVERNSVARKGSVADSNLGNRICENVHGAMNVLCLSVLTLENLHIVDASAELNLLHDNTLQKIYCDMSILYHIWTKSANLLCKLKARATIYWYDFKNIVYKKGIK